MKAYKKTIYLSTLCFGILGLTSFNPFNQKFHLSMLDNVEGSIELAQTTPGTLERIIRDSRPTFDQNLDGIPRFGKEEGQETVSPNTEFESIYSKEANNVFILKQGMESRAIQIKTTDGTAIYIDKIEPTGSLGSGGYKITYKISPSKELIKTITTEGTICRECKNELDSEHSFNAESIDLVALEKGDRALIRQLEGKLQSEFSKIQNGFQVVKKDDERIRDSEYADSCTTGDYSDQYSCLRNLKKDICTARQLRKEDSDCITKEEYFDLVASFLSDVAQDDDVSMSRLQRYGKLAAGNSDLSRAMAGVYQYKNFMNQTELFGRNAQRVASQVSRIDEQISYLDQFYGNPWAFEQQRVLNLQKNAIVMGFEKQAESFRAMYNRSSLSNSTLDSKYPELTTGLKENLELAYQDAISEISGSFFDPTLATLDKPLFTGQVSTRFSSNQNEGPSFGGNSQFPTQTQSGISNPSWQSQDPRYSSGWAPRQNTFNGNPNMYDAFDPRMSMIPNGRPTFGNPALASNGNSFRPGF